MGCVGEEGMGEAGVCGGIVGGWEHFVWYTFFTIKKCMSTKFAVKTAFFFGKVQK